MDVEFIGELRGALIRYDDARELYAAGWGQRYRGVVVETGTAPIEKEAAVLVHRIDTLDPSFQNDLDRARTAIAVARRAEVQACLRIRRLVDFRETRIRDEGPWDEDERRPWDDLRSAWEWVNTTLRDELTRDISDRERLASEVESSIGTALDCLHAAGLVHCDVAPNNIGRVGQTWKLIDLDRAVAIGDTIAATAAPPYALPSFNAGDPASLEMDDYGLVAILGQIRSPK